MAVVNAIGSIIMAIVNGVIAIIDAIVGLLTCNVRAPSPPYFSDMGMLTLFDSTPSGGAIASAARTGRQLASDGRIRSRSHFCMLLNNAKQANVM